MAVMFNSLVFGGIDSAEYGIYITGEAVYNAPERAVELVSVPGRNGQVAIDQGRWENVEVTYPAGCFGDSQADFAQKISAFRNAIASKIGYQRLTDTYNSDEYRMAMYTAGLEVNAENKWNGTAGEFNITFNCKPQRYLTSGEAPVTIGEWGETETVSGDIVQINNDGSLGVKSVLTTIEPIQSGSGTPSPTNIRPISGHTECVTSVVGKNWLPHFSNVSRGVSITVQSDGSCVVSGRVDSTAIRGTMDITLPSGSYIVSEGSTSGNVYLQINNTTTGQVYWSGGTSSFTYNGTDTLKARIWIKGGVDVNETIYPMVRLASETDTTYEPYAGHTYTTSLGRTVYGGTLDVVSGVLTVTDANIASYNGETLPSTWISDRDVYSSGTTPTTGAQVVYKLATPQTYQLTPQQIELLTGQNNLWVSTGDISVEIGLNPGILFNPTQYEARPLLAVTGDGTIDLAGQTIELIHQDLGDVDLFGAETKESPIGSNASATAYTFVLGTTDYFPSALLNQSDEITIRGATVGLRCDRNTRITAGSGTGIDGVTTRVGSSSIAWDFPDITIGFKDGTTYQAYTNNDIRVKNRRTGVTYTYRMTVQFKAPQYTSGGQVQIEVTLHKSSADPIWVKTGSASWQSVTAYSTASGLGNPTYIDCDLGEAYMYIGDDLYSLNGNIDLGSDVPVLKTGVNEITYDNTITELKITPRWWKL